MGTAAQEEIVSCLCYAFAIHFIPDFKIISIFINGDEHILNPGCVPVDWRVVEVRQSRKNPITINGTLFDISGLAEGDVLSARYSKDGVLVELAVCIPSTQSTQEYQLGEIPFIGHRGCGENKEKPCCTENTIDSFNKAQEMGFTMVELDVQLTEDNHLVVFHDTEINEKLVPTFTLEDLLALGPQDGVPITPFNKVLDSTGTLGLNIELKSPILSTIIPEALSNYSARVIQEVSKLTQSHPKRSYLFSSFDVSFCLLMKLINRSRKVCLLLSSEYTDRFSNEHLYAFLKKIQRTAALDGIIFDTECYQNHKTFITENLIARNYPILCYGKGANDIKTAMELCKDGVCSLITDGKIFCRSGANGFCTGGIDSGCFCTPYEWRISRKIQ